LGEGRELTFDIGGLLRLQLRRAEFMVAGTVTGGARRNAACGIPGKGQANGRIVFPKGVPGLKTLADKGRQAVGAACELSPDIAAPCAGRPHQQDTPIEQAVGRLGSRCNECKGARALPQLRPCLPYLSSIA
jgi:hypothetical protein